jgi:hypothetical protein
VQLPVLSQERQVQPPPQVLCEQVRQPEMSEPLVSQRAQAQRPDVPPVVPQ